MNHPSLDNLEETVGHQFASRALLEQALTHSSFASENTGAQDNEKLEFLGDSVLQLVSSRELFERFPSYHEGELSRLRAHLVNKKHLAHCARELELENYLRLGRGHGMTAGQPKSSMLADAMEAVIAALYLDGGMPVAHTFVRSRILDPELDRLSLAEGGVLTVDHRTRLQEILQASGQPDPRYEMVGEDGPAHRKNFTMQVIVLDPGNQTEFSTVGSGNTKKAASQSAAQKALEHLQNTSHG
jgi:ribonuclease-3